MPQLRFAGTVSVSVTVPVNPVLKATVIVEVADVLTVTAAGEVAPTLKLAVVKVNVVLWDAAPLVPVTDTVKVPDDVLLHDRLAVEGEGGNVTLVGLIAEQVSPAGTVSVNATVPANPLTPVTVIVDVPVAPTLAVTLLAAMVKSVTVNVAVVLWLRVPLVPVIVTV